MRERLKKERDEYEHDIKERQLRDLQLQILKLEEKREAVSLKEQDLRKKWRYLEKKKELLASDWDGLKVKNSALQQEKVDFDEWAGKLRETSQRLAEERDKVL